MRTRRAAPRFRGGARLTASRARGLGPPSRPGGLRPTPRAVRGPELHLARLPAWTLTGCCSPETGVKRAGSTVPAWPARTITPAHVAFSARPSARRRPCSESQRGRYSRAVRMATPRPKRRRARGFPGCAQAACAVSHSDRADPVHRGGVSSGELCARQYSIPCCPHTCPSAHAAGVSRRPGAHADDREHHHERRPRDQRGARSARARGTGCSRCRVGGWRSGLYFARLVASDGRVGFAPFVVPAQAVGSAQSRRRAADADVAGVQPARRRRGREGRQLVCGRA